MATDGFLRIVKRVRSSSLRCTNDKHYGQHGDKPMVRKQVSRRSAYLAILHFFPFNAIASAQHCRHFVEHRNSYAATKRILYSIDEC